MPAPCVLVVDDNLNVREVLGTVLERMGLRVVFAEDGYQCLQKLRQDGVDLVLIDLRLPGIVGLEVVRGIRKGRHCASRWPGSSVCPTRHPTWTPRPRILRRIDVATGRFPC